MLRRRPAFRRLPIRLRLTIAFAGVLALVLVAAGLALYEVFERDLDREIDDDLNTRSADVAALTARKQEPHFLLAGSGERIAQVYSADGRLLASTHQLGRSRLLSTAEML